LVPEFIEGPNSAPKRIIRSGTNARSNYIQAPSLRLRGVARHKAKQEAVCVSFINHQLFQAQRDSISIDPYTMREKQSSKDKQY